MPLPRRCPWVNETNPLSIHYHDEEWGVPSHEDRHLFEMLLLEGAQAGLSWETILNKRAGYRRAFDSFEPTKIARYTAAKQAALLTDPGIVRNRLKVAAAVTNAQAFMHLTATFGSFDAYLWRFVDGRPQCNAWQSRTQVPVATAISAALSRDLKARGFKFIGSTICYAFMQAVGLVNDHVTTCFRYEACAALH